MQFHSIFSRSSLLLTATLVLFTYGCGETIRSGTSAADPFDSAAQSNQKDAEVGSSRFENLSTPGGEQTSAQTADSAQLLDGYYAFGGTGQGIEVRGSEYRYYDEGGEQAWQPVSDLTVIGPELVLYQDNYWCHTDNVPQSGGVCTPDGWQSYDSVGTISSSEMALGGVEAGASEAEVLSQLGAPDQADEVSPFSKRLTYIGMSMSFYEDAALNIRSVSADYCTPSGLCPGDATSDAIDLYGAPIVNNSSGSEYWEYGADNACAMELEVTNETISAIALICQI